MDFHHRKLAVETSYCKTFCIKDGPSNCKDSCPVLCPNKCVPYGLDRIPVSSPPTEITHNSHKASNFLIATIVFLVASFLLICVYAFYKKYYNRNSRRRNSSSQFERQVHEEFVDEEHGPMVDHPIWYIRTAGLQPSVINSITVLNYKKGDGVVEGTECSVCLNEFQEDERVRLLPKCSHAFHIPCIDTWLRSHTNCPMCRAPIVINAVIRNSLPEPSGVGSGSEEEAEMGNSESNSENDTDVRRGEDGKRGESSVADDVVQPSRRSVSLDSLSALEIRQAVSKERDGSVSDKQLELVNKLSTAIGAKRVGGNWKLQRMRSGSSNERSLQSGPVSMKRSVSCNGNFVLCTQIRSSDSILPLRSI